MDKVKQETFSNFHYEMIKSIDDRCADVKCTYTYKGKNLTHYFSYAKSGKKPDSYYINKAKADMNKIVKEKSPDNVAKKDLNGKKATFFRRHKKPILIATTAVLVAGIATAATLVALKYLNKPDPEAVTEEEIDKHIVFPSDEMTLMNDYSTIQKIVSDAICNVTVDGGSYYYDDDDVDKFNNILRASSLVYKRLGTAYEHTADPFAYSSQPVITVDDEIKHKDSSNANVTFNEWRPELLKHIEFNDTSVFYTNNSFKTKAINSTYLNMNFEQNPQFIKTKVINAFEEGAENKFENTIYTSYNNTTHKEDKNGDEVLFETGTTDYNGLQTEDLASILPTRSSKKGSNTVEQYQDCEDTIRYDVGHSMMNLAEAYSLINPSSEKFGTFYQKNDDEIYSISYAAEGQREAVTIPSIYYPDTGVLGYIDPIYIWHFVRKDSLKTETSLGWTLESYAYDKSVYSDYDDLYQKLNKPITVNKDKGFVEFKYDKKVDSTEDLEKVKIPTDKDGKILGMNQVQAPSFPAYDMWFEAWYYDSEWWQYTNFDVYPQLHDATAPYRIFNDSKGYMLTSTIYVPSYEEYDHILPLYYYIGYSSEYFSGDEYVVKYNLTKNAQKYAYELKGEDDSLGIVFKNDEYVTTAGKYFNVTVTYENSILSVDTSRPDKDSILIPTSIDIAPAE